MHFSRSTRQRLQCWKVWIYGNWLLTYAAGEEATDFFGTTLHDELISTSDSTNTVFVGSRTNHLGEISVIRTQGIVSSPTSENLAPSNIGYIPIGITSGNNLGQSIAVVQYDSSGNRALIVGAPGEHEMTPVSYMYNRPGGEYSSKGSFCNKT